MNVLKTLLLLLTAITIMNPYTICNHWLTCLLKPGLPDVEPDLPVLLFLSKERLVVSYYFNVNIADLVLRHKLVSENLTKQLVFMLRLKVQCWSELLVQRGDWPFGLSLVVLWVIISNAVQFVIYVWLYGSWHLPFLHNCSGYDVNDTFGTLSQKVCAHVSG